MIEAGPDCKGAVTGVCRVASAEFGPELSAPTAARHWASERLRRWEVLGPVDEVILLISELVANAVLHAESGTEVRLSVDDGNLEVGVSDHEPRMPGRLPLDQAGPGLRTGTAEPLRMAQERFMDEGGRGLLLVDAVADEWGAKRLAAGKQVWFRIGLEPGWPYQLGCSCSADGDDRLMLGSGHYARAMPGAWDD